MRSHLFALLLVATFSMAAGARADDAFYEVHRGELRITEGTWPVHERNWTRPDRAPRVVLEGEGEAYCSVPSARGSMDELVVVVRAPGGVDVRGKLFVPNEKGDGMTPLSFVIPAGAARPGAREAFYRTKRVHYESLLDAGLPGAAWFRHRAREAVAALGDEGRGVRERVGRQRTPMLDDTFALFTGGAAVSENLQLDRPLIVGPGAGEKAIDVDAIEGITVREFDWGPLVKDAKPEVDPLASLIPADQHAVFVRSFDAGVRLLEEGLLLGAETLGLEDPPAEEAMTVARYQAQLCLPLTTIGRLAGPRLVRSIAVTGSDVYFRSGTDVAVLFEATKANELAMLLGAQMAAARQGNRGAEAVSGEAGGVAYRGVVSADRSIRAYLAVLGDVVVVTNSLEQLERIAATRQGKGTTLGSLAEYKFFRDRYRRTDADETALVILSDATIRRWCGARWRIADSRRTRAAAALAGLQAEHHEEIVKRTVRPRALAQELIEGDVVRLEAHGATSATYGRLGFMTPIVEMEVGEATEAERAAYERWRDTYQQNWRNYFDPIAIRIASSDEKLAADVTVMPLIANSDYRHMAEVTRGKRLGPDAGDPHDEAVLQVAFSIGDGSEIIESWFGKAQAQVVREQVLPWLGDSASLFVDARPEGSEKGIPVAVRIDSRDHEKLKAFMPAARVLFDGSAPGKRKWETREHRGVSYISSVSAEDGKGEVSSRWAVHVVALPDALTGSFNEGMIQATIERHLARAEREGPAAAGAKGEAAPGAEAARPWVGANVGVRVEPGFLKLLAQYGVADYGAAARRASWRNLPILNEWKRLYPERDPVAVHERMWGVRLICPAGGAYAWNEEDQTMESSVAGHPGRAKVVALTSPMLERIRSADFGLDFEHDGLRARAVLWRAAETKDDRD